MAKNQLRDYDKKFLKNDRKKEMSEEQRKAAGERMKKYQESKKQSE